MGIIAGIFPRTLGAPIGCIVGLILSVVAAAAPLAELNTEISVDGEDAAAVGVAYLKSKRFLP